jgi:hypothetical protein
MDALKKAEKELDEESSRAMQLGFYRSILTLSTEFGWKKLRIERFLDNASDVYTECRGDGRKSLIQMCDEETGIEVRNDADESYLDTPYLCQEIWDRERVRYEKMPYPMQRAYFISVRQHMKKWMYAQVMASIILALHRKEGWGHERIVKFLEASEKYKANQNIEELKATVESETGMKYVWTGQDLCLVNKEFKGITNVVSETTREVDE